MSESEIGVVPITDPKDKYIFDQYSRYLAVSKVFDAVADSKNTAVLDVGSGDECILGNMLAEHAFTFIDPLLADKEGESFGNHEYLAGTIFDSRLDDCSFGAVTSIDVLEHIPKDKREAFLARVSELATDLVVLAFPCEELPSEELDKELNEKYRSIFGKDYPWLEEHFEFGMPSLDDVDAFFRSKGWHTCRFGQGHIPWLSEFLGFSLAGLEEEVLSNAVSSFSLVFNEIAAGYDMVPPFYRYVFVASKKDISDHLTDLFSSKQLETDMPALTDQLRKTFYDCILKEGKAGSVVLSELREQLQASQVNEAAISEQWQLSQANEAAISEQLQASQANEAAISEQLQASQANEAAISEQWQLSQANEAAISEQLQASQANEAAISEQWQLSQANAAAISEQSEIMRQQLERERFTVIRPLCRRLYRFGVRVTVRLPLPIQSVIRRVKSKFIPQKLVHHLPLLSVPMGGGEGKILPPLVTPLICEASGYDVIVFPVIDWHFRIQRPQHIARELAKSGHRVFYFSALFSEGDGGVNLVEKIEDSVFLCQFILPSPHPSIYKEMPSKKQKDILITALDEFMELFRVHQVVALIDHPFWVPVAQSIPGASIIYDCMDDHGGFSNNTNAILKAEQDLLQQADIVVTASAKLSEKIGKVRANTIIRNAAEITRFSARPKSLLYDGKRPVVGYYGAISEWFDIDLVISAAKYYPEYDFVLIGSTYMCDIQHAKKIKNIHFIGEVPYETLTGYLYAFDVCLIPFKLIELIQCTNPVKIYEYLAAGKPVVVTDMPELRLIEEYVYLSTDQNSFISNIQKAINEKDKNIAKRQAFACENDWSNRAERFDLLISDLHPLVSVVVLTYNNLEFTEACLHSLELNTNYSNWELIIVDNASTDGTPEFLREYAASRDHVSLILNDENLGFAAGNNVGLKQAKGEFQILLNNDTYVTPGWLKDLVRHFDDESIGLVGPVTNNIGNEAKVDIQYFNMVEMVEAARVFTRVHSREHIFVDTAAFFCVAIRKEVIEKVGLLDEAFGRGFFEDDDYCIRARKAGYKVAIADDVFVHHHLSASFNKLKDEEKQNLFEKNKAIYEAKWEPWVQHKYREGL